MLTKCGLYKKNTLKKGKWQKSALPANLTSQQLAKYGRTFRENNTIFMDPARSKKFKPLDSRISNDDKSPRTATDEELQLVTSGLMCFCFDQLGNVFAESGKTCSFCALFRKEKSIDLWDKEKDNDLFPSGLVFPPPMTPCQKWTSAGYAHFISELLSCDRVSASYIKAVAEPLLPVVKKTLTPFFCDDVGRLVKACACFIFDLCKKQPRLIYIIYNLIQCLKLFACRGWINIDFKLVPETTSPSGFPIVSLAMGPKFIVSDHAHFCYATLNSIGVALDQEMDDPLLIHYRSMSDGSKESILTLPIWKGPAATTFNLNYDNGEQGERGVTQDAYRITENMVANFITTA